MSWKQTLKDAKKQGHGEAAKLARLADREGLTLSFVATQPELLDTVGLDLEDVNPLVVHQAEKIHATWWEDLQRRVRKHNSRVDEVQGIEKPQAYVPDNALQEGKRVKIMGHPATAVVRWMGVEDWEFSNAKKVLKHFKVSMADSTVRIQLAAGKNGSRGEPAKLTLRQENELYDLLQ